MLNRFKAFVSEQHLFSDREEVLLAVSGGIDSVSLCDLMFRSGFHFAIAHCNFNLRPGDCDRDESFVNNLADTYGVPFHNISFDTMSEAKSNGESIEEAARRLRYSFFKQLMGQYGYSCVATAHHRDDSIETFFINLLRGTGILGLHGILPKTNSIVRPLLRFSRAEIECYVRSRNLQWVEDYTNDSLEYARNRIRHKLMPLLRELSPSIDSIMEANIENLTEAGEIYTQYVSNERARILHSIGDGGFYIDICDIDSLSPKRTLMYEILCRHPFSFPKSCVESLISSLCAEPGRQFFSQNYRLLKDRSKVFVYPLDKVQDQEPSLRYEYISRQSDTSLKCTKGQALFDADKVDLPLSLRKWRNGDRFVPFGMKGSRLISDYLKDEHLSLIEKEGVWLLTDAHDRVLWVVGMRADGRFSVTNSTTSILMVSLEKQQ